MLLSTPAPQHPPLADVGGSLGAAHLVGVQGIAAGMVRLVSHLSTIGKLARKLDRQ